MSSSLTRKGSVGYVSNNHSPTTTTNVLTSNMRTPSYDLFPKSTVTTPGLSRSNTIGARPVMSQPRKMASHSNLVAAGATLDTTATLPLSKHSHTYSKPSEQPASHSFTRTFSLRRKKSQTHKKSASAATATPLSSCLPISLQSVPVPRVPTETVRVFCGPEQQEFVVNRAALCACSPFFRDHLSSGTAKLSLPTETPAMFELFSVWLHTPSGFQKRLEKELNLVESQPGRTVESASASSRLHWTLVRLHLYAAVIELAPLQDFSMDAIQDLYLRREWDVTPRFVRFIYSQCDPVAAMRLRRWAVAMVAYFLACHTSATPLPSGSGTGTAAQSDIDKQRDATAFYQLLAHYPEFQTDYTIHLRKMAASGLNLALKNPQLRIPSNALHNDQRRFAFRQCAFHTHRATAGNGRCPYGGDEDIDGREGLIRSKSRRVRHAQRQAQLNAELEKQRVRQAELEKKEQREALTSILQQEHDVLGDRERGRPFTRSRIPVQAAPKPSINYLIQQSARAGDFSYGHIRSVSDTTVDRPQSRGRSQTRHQNPNLTGIPEAYDPEDHSAAAATTNLRPPIPPMPFMTYSSPSPSSPSLPQTARMTPVRNREYVKSYTSSVYSHITTDDAPPVPALPRAETFQLVSGSSGSLVIPMVETLSTSPPPYMHHAAPANNLSVRQSFSHSRTPSNTSAISRGSTTRSISSSMSRSPIDGPAIPPPFFSTPNRYRHHLNRSASTNASSSIGIGIGVAATTDAPASPTLSYHSQQQLSTFSSSPAPLGSRSFLSPSHSRSMSSSPRPCPAYSQQALSFTPRRQPPVLANSDDILPLNAFPFPATSSSRPGTATSTNTTAAPFGTYHTRRLPARPATANTNQPPSQSSSQEPSPLYTLNGPSFNFDVPQIRQLKTRASEEQIHAGHRRKFSRDNEFNGDSRYDNNNSGGHGVVDELLDEVAIALHMAQRQTERPQRPARRHGHSQSQSSVQIATAF